MRRSSPPPSLLNTPCRRIIYAHFATRGEPDPQKWKPVFCTLPPRPFFHRPPCAVAYFPPHGFFRPQASRDCRFFDFCAVFVFTLWPIEKRKEYFPFMSRWSAFTSLFLFAAKGLGGHVWASERLTGGQARAAAASFKVFAFILFCQGMVSPSSAVLRTTPEFILRPALINSLLRPAL